MFTATPESPIRQTKPRNGRRCTYLAKPPSISPSHPTSYSPAAAATPAGKTRFSAERYFQQCKFNKREIKKRLREFTIIRCNHV